MSEFDRDDNRSSPRAAGIAYLVTIAAGLFAEAYVRGSIRVSGDALATAENIRTLEPLFRAGILADCVMIGAYAVVTALLYRLFKRTSASISLVAALFSLLGMALLASMTLLLILVLQNGSFAYDALRLHGAAFGLTGMFFGPYCLLIGWLILRSGLLPRAIGWLMSLAGAVFVADATLTLVAPSLARSVPDVVMLISLVGEGSLAIWLAAFGVRHAQALGPHERAPAIAPKGA